MKHRINGFQHIGVAVSDMDRSLKFYRKYFGLDIPFFDAVAPADLMLPYTRNEVITKRASMVLNLMGGCAMEVIQATSFTPSPPAFRPQLGDLGIFVTQMKSPDVRKMHAYCVSEGDVQVSDLRTRFDGSETFFLTDPDGNHFQVLAGGDWYTKKAYLAGGVQACTIGVSDMDRALELYRDILGYDKLLHEEKGVVAEWGGLPGAERSYHRVVLTPSQPAGGGFARVAGSTQIELIQDLDRTPKRIFEDRIWADLGFVHLGLDVRGMASLGQTLAEKGFGFTCDSNSALSMGNTKVHCTYIDDPDETWIELIEVHKVPIVEKWGLYLNVAKRNPDKPLPDLMLKALRFSRIKD